MIIQRGYSLYRDLGGKMKTEQIFVRFRIPPPRIYGDEGYKASREWFI